MNPLVLLNADNLGRFSLLTLALLQLVNYETISRVNRPKDYFYFSFHAAYLWPASLLCLIEKSVQNFFELKLSFLKGAKFLE